LKSVDIYTIVDPDTTSENQSPNYISANDVKYLNEWVSEGGIMLLLANDKPNCEFTHFNELSKTFGFYFQTQTLNKVSNSNWEMAAETNLLDHPLFSGEQKIYMKDVAPVVLSLNAKPVLKDNNHVLIAETQFGNGYVLAVGESLAIQ